MSTAVVVLTREGLAHARRLREVLGAETSIFGPSCVVGACGGRPSHGETFPTGEPGVFGWVGSIRKVYPRLREESGAVVALMPVGSLARLDLLGAGPWSARGAAVAVDDAARFAVCLDAGADPEAGASITRRVAEALGATPVVMTAAPRGRPGAEGRTSTGGTAGTGS